jgi:hypothetical protein
MSIGARAEMALRHGITRGTHSPRTQSQLGPVIFAHTEHALPVCMNTSAPARAQYSLPLGLQSLSKVHGLPKH